MLSKSIKETEKIASMFLSDILKNKHQGKGALVFGLSGDLGAGKTAFTQAVARYLGVKEKVNSPTFVLMKKYILPKSKTHTHMFHLDAYRLKDERELLQLGWKEIINNKTHIVFIEWPELVKKAIPKSARYVYITHEKSGSRNLKLK